MSTRMEGFSVDPKAQHLIDLHLAECAVIDAAKAWRAAHIKYTTTMDRDFEAHQIAMHLERDLFVAFIAAVDKLAALQAGTEKP